MILRLFSVVVLLAWCQTLLAQHEGREHEIPLFIAHDDPDDRQGFIRVTNHSDEAGVVHIRGVDDAGNAYGPVMLRLEAGETQPFNSQDLESGNDAKGIAAGLGDGEGDWRLLMQSTLDIEPLNYVRTGGGFLTAMNDVVGEVAMGHRVAIFNPGSNTNQVSWLRLINPGNAVARVTITASDEDGAAPGGQVTLTLAAGAARRITAQQLEVGDADLNGNIGDGRGKWSLWISSNQPIRAMSLMDTLTGELSNLSGANPGYVGAAGLWEVSFADGNGGSGYIMLLPDSRLYAWLPEAGDINRIARGVYSSQSGTVTASGDVYESGKIEQQGFSVVGGGDPVTFTAEFRGGDWIRGTYAVDGGSDRAFHGWAFTGFRRGGATAAITGTWNPLDEEPDLPASFMPDSGGAFADRLVIDSPLGELDCGFSGTLRTINPAFNLYESQPEIDCGLIVFAEGAVEMIVGVMDSPDRPGDNARALVLAMVPDDDLAAENRRKIGLGGFYELTR